MSSSLEVLKSSAFPNKKVKFSILPNKKIRNIKVEAHSIAIVQSQRTLVQAIYHGVLTNSIVFARRLTVR